MWKNLEFNSNNVQTETAKSVLIKVPGSKLKFWHPSKLVRYKGKGGYLVSIGFTDDFTFNLFRNGEGKYNSREKIEEVELTANEFVEKYFNGEVA
jgi:hypothetical protein